MSKGGPAEPSTQRCREVEHNQIGGQRKKNKGKGRDHQDSNNTWNTCRRISAPSPGNRPAVFYRRVVERQTLDPPEILSPQPEAQEIDAPREPERTTVALMRYMASLI